MNARDYLPRCIVCQGLKAERRAILLEVPKGNAMKEIASANAHDTTEW